MGDLSTPPGDTEQKQRLECGSRTASNRVPARNLASQPRKTASGMILLHPRGNDNTMWRNKSKEERSESVEPT